MPGLRLTKWLGLAAEEATEVADQKRQGWLSEESERAAAREAAPKPATRKEPARLGSRREERKRRILGAADREGLNDRSNCRP